MKRKIPVFTLAKLRLVDCVIALGMVGLLAGGVLVGKHIAESSVLQAQIVQIARYDEAVAEFYKKYEGLPGDLLAVKAERAGLAYGNGYPAHGDGDGKISPCTLGWEWNLGCETALFWSHLEMAGFLSENFNADSRLTDARFPDAQILNPYLPRSPMGEKMYVAIWNSDAAIAPPEPRLPYGNYYEISRINGIKDSRISDDTHAMTPLEALAIDTKMDDGLPYAGRVVANGEAKWPDAAWGTFAKKGTLNCVAPDKNYNTKNFFRSRIPLCHLAIRLDCCDKDE